MHNVSMGESLGRSAARAQRNADEVAAVDPRGQPDEREVLGLELTQFVATLLQITGAGAGRTSPPGLIVLTRKQLRWAGGASSRYRACGAAWARRCPRL